MARSIFSRPAPDRRAVDLEQRLLSDQPSSPAGTRAAQDPASSAGRVRASFSQGGFLIFGRIWDSIAYTHTYKVKCERGIGEIKCCDGASTGLGVVGARQINTYPIGTGVLVFYHPQALNHTIVCSVPDWMIQASDALSDFIVQGSNCGLQVDGVHRFPFSLPNIGISDFSAGRPADSLQNGEWGAISELGIRIMLDSMHAQIAVDETTGLVLCYADQYARLSGVNLDLRSSGSCREDRNDESELSSVEEYSPYPWEVLGVAAFDDNPFRSVSAQGCQQDTPYYAPLEPSDDRQLGIYRDRRFRGYLGQGDKSQIIVPTEPGVHTYDSDANSLLGLLETNRLMDGTYGVRSARGIFFAKVPLIPAPKRAQRPESDTGDRTSSNYQSCGLFGEGPPHLVASLPADSNALPHVIEPAAVFDMLSHLFNWKGLLPFHYHDRDWYLAEESAMAAASSLAVPPFADLASQTFLPMPESFSVKVDERYGLTEYYSNLAFFSLLPRGGIMQVDGWGAEQRSSAGTQYMHAPADLVLTAGRNIVLQAGGSIILKGYDGVELSATLGSTRIEAHESVLIMGGNGGCGGVLIESLAATPSFVLGNPDKLARVTAATWTAGVASMTAANDFTVGDSLIVRGFAGDFIGYNGESYIVLDADATSFTYELPVAPAGAGNSAGVAMVIGTEDQIGGVVLRAASGAVIAEAGHIQLTTAVWGSNATGHIVLDAGASRITERADEFYRHASTCCIDFLGSATVNEYWEDTARISTPLTVVGDTFLWGDSFINGNLVVGQNVAFTSVSYLTTGQTTQLGDIGSEITSRDLSQVQTDSVSLITHFYDVSDLPDLTFYFRDAPYYRTWDFQICEPIWAQLARLGSGQVPATWTEDFVGGGTPTSAPYPGLSVLQDDNTFGQQDLTMFDPVTMASADRGEIYENAQIAGTTWISLDGNWPITV